MKQLEEISEVLLEITNQLKNIEDELKNLKIEVNENETLLISLLKLNNKHTEHIYNASIKDKSSEQQLKDFSLNVLANIAGNSIKSPILINLEK